MNAFAGFISLNHDPVPIETIKQMGQNLVAYQPDETYYSGDSKARFVQLIRYNLPESRGSKQRPYFLHDVRLDDQGQGGFCDAILVYEAYQHKGPGCLENLIGDFAFTIWDPDKETLFGSRDQMGQRLIYYTYQPGKFFAFATVISGVLALNQVSRQINKIKVTDFLKLDAPRPEQTFFFKNFVNPNTITRVQTRYIQVGIGCIQTRK